jgi:hypothetical protein
MQGWHVWTDGRTGKDMFRPSHPHHTTNQVTDRPTRPSHKHTQVNLVLVSVNPETLSEAFKCVQWGVVM